MAQSLVARSPVTAYEARLMLQKIKLENMGIARIASQPAESSNFMNIHPNSACALRRTSFFQAKPTLCMSNFAQPVQLDSDEMGSFTSKSIIPPTPGMDTDP